MVEKADHTPLISVCVPAYKHPEYVARLLDSLVSQTFSDFEVVLTDDSPDTSVQELVQQYQEKLTLRYHRNSPALGTPANWNEAMRRAKGQWIKLIHDDDWLAAPDSLAHYVAAIEENEHAAFLISSYRNVTGQSSSVAVHPSPYRLRALQQNPVTLLSKNIIGPPSVVIHRNDQKHFYDENLRWLVDMDFYIRYLEHHRAVHIDKELVNIGLNELQVTKSSSLVREVEIPEHFHVLEKTGISQLRNLLVYDAWWRLFRNLQIRNASEIAASGYQGELPAVLLSMINFQTRYPLRLLRIGIVSKALMLSSYTYNQVAGNFAG